MHNKIKHNLHTTYSPIKGGRSYFGEMLRGKEHGLGFYDLELWQQKFIGEFDNNKATGIGLKIQGYNTPWQRKFVGEFKNNAHSGIGMYTWPSGAKYIGSFKNDVAKGLGIFVTWEGLKYIGNMSEDDDQIGVKNVGCKGHDFWIRGDGQWYFSNDQYIDDITSLNYDIHGFKRLGNKEYWPDGTYYIGDFKDGLYDGYGHLYFTSDRYYCGDFLKGEFHGQGIFYHGKEYVKGEFKQHHIDGYAEAFFKNGSYKGYWQKNRFHGEGIFQYFDDIFEGKFYNININDGGGRDTGFISK